MMKKGFDVKNYIIDETKRTVVRSIRSKGEDFYAHSKCETGDKFIKEIGMAIVDYRLEIAQRRRDLKNTNEFIATLTAMDKEKMEKGGRKETSKHYIRSVQKACEERNSQYENIKYCKMRLKQLSSGDPVLAILSIFQDGRLTIEEANNLIKSL